MTSAELTPKYDGAPGTVERAHVPIVIDERTACQRRAYVFKAPGRGLNLLAVSALRPTLTL